MQRSFWVLEERHKQVTSTVGSICLTDFTLKKISCHEKGQQRIKLLVRPSATESSVNGEFVMQEWDHQHPKIGREGRVIASRCVMRQCVGTLSSPLHRALGADWGASFSSGSPLHGKRAEKLYSGSYSNMLADRVCRFGVLMLQAHRQLFLIYAKMFVISLNHFAWWSLKHVTPACSGWQAKLRSWIFGAELMSENILLVDVCKAWTASGVCSVWRALGRRRRWIFRITFEYFLCFCWAFDLFNLTSSCHCLTVF